MSFLAKVTWELQLLLSAQGLSSAVTVFALHGQGPGSLDLSSADASGLDTGCVPLRSVASCCGMWHPAVLPFPLDQSGWLEAQHRVSTGDVGFNCLITGEPRFQGAALRQGKSYFSSPSLSSLLLSSLRFSLSPPAPSVGYVSCFILICYNHYLPRCSHCLRRQWELVQVGVCISLAHSQSFWEHR